MMAPALNDVIRGVINQLVEDGYKKKPICDVTLGSQSLPQFSDLVDKGKDLGLKPLERFLSGLGYDVLVVPVAKDDKETLEFITNATKEFASDMREQLVSYLDNRPMAQRGPKTGKGKMSNVTLNDVDDILSNL